MKKQWYNIYTECIKENALVTAKLGEVSLVGKIKSEGMAYITCKALQEAIGENFRVYYK